MISPLGLFRSTFGDAVYLAAKVGEFFLGIFVNVKYNSIVFAFSFSSFAKSPYLFSESDSSVDKDTGEFLVEYNFASDWLDSAQTPPRGDLIRCGRVVNKLRLVDSDWVKLSPHVV